MIPFAAPGGCAAPVEVHEAIIGRLGHSTSMSGGRAEGALDHAGIAATDLMTAYMPPDQIVAARSGVRAATMERIRATCCDGAPRRRVMFPVILPSEMPDILTATRAGIGIGFGWTSRTGAETDAATEVSGQMVPPASRFPQTSRHRGHHHRPCVRPPAARHRAPGRGRKGRSRDPTRRGENAGARRLSDPEAGGAGPVLRRRPQIA